MGTLSFDALSWAAKQRCGSSGAKLVLLGLAECAGRKDALAYPSIAELIEFSSLDRKSIIANLAKLEALKLIEATGDKVGRTKQIKVYRLCLELGATRSGERHYTYRLTDAASGAFYVGVRSCFGEPVADSYMGSGKWPTGAAFQGVTLTKHIIAEYGSRTEAELAEADLIAKALSHPLCKNLAKEAHKRDASQTVPKTGSSNSTVFSAKSPKNGTRNKSEPVGSEAKASSPKRATFPPPDGVPEMVWRDFLESPKRRKAGMSSTAYAGIKNNLTELAEHGFPPGEMIALAVERGWTTVKLDWVKNDGQQRTNGLARNQPPDGLSSTTRAALRVFGPGDEHAVSR